MSKEQEQQKDRKHLSDSEKKDSGSEGLITSNANGNGINPNPIESGNADQWETRTQQAEQYKKDAASGD